MDHDISALKKQLLQLAELQQAGALTAEQHAQSKALVERRILDLVMAGYMPAAEVMAANPVAPAAAMSVGMAPSMVGAAAIPSAAKASVARQSKSLLWALSAFVFVVAAGGYWWTRTPEPENMAAAESGAAGQPHATSAEQIDGMIDRLSSRLKENPADAAGWAMLARSYSVVGRNAESLDAYVQALKLSKDDPALMVDYADALAVKNNRLLDGEPIKLVERALKIDPRNVKGLALSGTYAFSHKDYKTAVKQWEQVTALGGPESAFVQQIQAGLKEARELAGLPPAPEPAAGRMVATPVSDTGADAAPAAAKGAVGVRGTVTLAAALASKVAPGDTIFVTARAPEGSRMPLAVLRKQVKDLPLNFVLDDSMAMSPAARISSASKVIVTARVSKSGNAIAQPGDLMGQSVPVSVSATGVAIEISESVKP